MEQERNQRALLSLDGLSVGDALGERFFGPPDQVLARIAARELPPEPWRWTDDTQMALSIVELLLHQGTIDPDALALKFAARYEPDRGYGGGAHGLLQSFRRGVSWREAAAAMFHGTGSYGNGAAMRVSPIGGYFADDLGAVVENADRSARVTHAHAEAVAGAIAVAVAAATAWRAAKAPLTPAAFFEAVLARTPRSLTRERLLEAQTIDAATPPAQVAARIGSGQEIAAHDTVPFALWCAAHHLDSYEEAFWTTLAGLGDRDTTCAIVGGIVALSSQTIPQQWRARREPLTALD